MMTAETEAEINAPATLVWGVILDLDRYPEWNPFIVKVDCPGGPRIGASIGLHLRWGRPDGKEIVSRERIKRIEPPKAGPDSVSRALYGYGFDGALAKLGLIYSYRDETLEQASGGKTRYCTRVEVRGPAGRLAPMSLIQHGIERQTTALKVRCEMLKSRRA
jgi:hypothetical protein